MTQHRALAISDGPNIAAAEDGECLTCDEPATSSAYCDPCAAEVIAAVHRRGFQIIPSH